MSTNKDISKIKESFENQNFKAPEYLWNSISEKMDADAIDNVVKESYANHAPSFTAPAFDALLTNESNQIDKLVSDSYEQTQAFVPASAWEKIQDGLDVSAVWDRMSDKIEVTYVEKISYWLAASIALLLALVPFNVSDTEYLDMTTLSSSLLADNYTESVEADLTINNDILIADNNIVLPQDGFTINGEEPFTNDNDTRDTQFVEEDDRNQFNESIANSNDVQFLEKASTELLANNLNAPQIELVPKKDQRKWKFAVGAIGGISNTWILDSETRASFDKESLSESKMAFGTMYGITADAVLNDKNYFSTNIYLNSRMQNRLGYFDNGDYKIRKTTLDFFEASFLYGRKFTFHGKKHDHNLIVKAGPYVGVNKRSSVLDGDIITSYNTDFKKLDYGMYLLAGQEYNVSNFTLGYGIHSRFGVRNIFSGNSYLPEKLNFTNNASLGLYLSLKYNL